MEKIDIIDVSTPFINGEGRLIKHNFFSEKAMVLDVNGKSVTKRYQAMEFLCDDHYAVCDLIINDAGCYLEDFYHTTERKEKTVKASYKWGVIRVNRDYDGKIIPYMEELVVPYLFESQEKGNLNTIIGLYNGRYIYIDLDVKSELYGNTLTPLLDYTEPFNFKYNGFAECTINDTVGYFPRNCIKRFNLQPNDLLTGQQALNLSLYLNDKLGGSLSIDAIMAYKSLTGSNPREQKIKKFNKKKGI